MSPVSSPLRIALSLACLALAAVGQSFEFEFTLCPEVREVVPANDAHAVATTSSIRLVMKEEIDPELVEAGMANIGVVQFVGGIPSKEIEGEVTYDKESKALVFKPKKALPAERKFMVTGSVMDLSVKMMVMQMWTFDTMTKAAARPAAEEKGGDGEGSKNDGQKVIDQWNRDRATGDEKKGWVALEEQRWRDAEFSFQSVINLDPKNARARYGQTEARFRLYPEECKRSPDGAYQSLIRNIENLLQAYVADPKYWRESVATSPERWSIAAFSGIVGLWNDTVLSAPTPVAECWAALADHIAAGGTLPVAMPKGHELIRVGYDATLRHANLAMSAAGYARLYAYGVKHLDSPAFPASVDEIAAREDATSDLRFEIRMLCGSRLLREGRHRDAEHNGRDADRCFRFALQERKESSEAEIGLAIALRLQEKLPTALKSLERAVRYRPDSSSAHLLLSVYRRAAKDEAGAEAARDAGIKAAASLADGWTDYAALLEGEARREEAAAASRFEPVPPAGAASDASAEAARAYFRGAQESGEDKDRWAACALACYRLQDFASALLAAEKMVSLGRTDVESLTIVAELRARQEGPERALPAFEAALAADPESQSPWRSLRLAFWDAKRRDLSVNALRRISEKVGATCASECELGFAHALAGNLDASVAAYVAALRRAGKESMVYRSLYELSRAVEGGIVPLAEGILGEEPAHVAISDLENCMRDRLQAAAFRRMLADLSGPVLGARESGISYVGSSANREYREWQSQTAGKFGAVGLFFTD